MPATDHARAAEGDGDAFGDVIAQGFGSTCGRGSPRCRAASAPPCVAAFEGERALAAGAVYVGGGIAWLGFGATLPLRGGRGAQGGLLAPRIDEAAARGARVAVTETGERVPEMPSASYRNILRAGFEEAYLRSHFLAPAA